MHSTAMAVCEHAGTGCTNFPPSDAVMLARCPQPSQAHRAAAGMGCTVGMNAAAAESWQQGLLHVTADTEQGT